MLVALSLILLYTDCKLSVSNGSVNVLSTSAFCRVQVSTLSGASEHSDGCKWTVERKSSKGGFTFVIFSRWCAYFYAKSVFY